MQIDKQKLITAAKKVGIAPSAAEELWSELGPATPRNSKFDLSTILYYCGALIVILGMGWILGNAWAHVGGTTLFFIALAYILIFAGVGFILAHKTAYKIAGGLFITMAVAIVPIMIYGLLKWTGWGLTNLPAEYQSYPQLTFGGKLALQGCTALAGLLAFRWIRFPFLLVPIIIALWFFALTLIPPIWGHRANSFKGKAWVSFTFGLLTLAWAYIMDLEGRKKFAFWGYLLGLAAFWGAAALLYVDMRISPSLFCFINIALILLAVLFQRALFIIFGALGIFILILESFYHSAWFPILMSLIGLSIIVVGLLYRKNREKIQNTILHRLPQGISNWLPKK